MAMNLTIRNTIIILLFLIVALAPQIIVQYSLPFATLIALLAINQYYIMYKLNKKKEKTIEEAWDKTKHIERLVNMRENERTKIIKDALHFHNMRGKEHENH